MRIIFNNIIILIKLFDYDASSSSSSVEEDEREEKRPLQDKQKIEKYDDLKAETEMEVDLRHLTDWILYTPKGQITPDNVYLMEEN